MTPYKLSDLIKDAADMLAKEGDVSVVADVLTENQSNLFDICHGLDVFDNKCYITLDLDHLTPSEFKKQIK